MGASKDYSRLSEREIKRIEEEWNRAAREVGLREEIEDWELRSLFT